MLSCRPKEDTSPTIKKLIDACFDAKCHAYCPYSNFPVGAALLCTDGMIFPGCNVENAAHSPGVCAERTAICNAVVNGHRKFTAIAVCSDVDGILAPCGTCRQTLAEFGLDWTVYMARPDRSFISKTVRELIPLAPDPEIIASFNNNNNSIVKAQQKLAADETETNGSHLSVTTA